MNQRAHFITRPVNAADLDRRVDNNGYIDLKKGELWVIGAKPSMGKTGLVETVQAHAQRAAEEAASNTGPRIPRPAHAARMAASISAARQAANDRLTQAERDHAKQLDSAFQLGRECGQREEGRTSWRWGVVCGMPVGAALVVVALVLGAGSI